LLAGRKPLLCAERLAALHCSGSEASCVRMAHNVEGSGKLAGEGLLGRTCTPSPAALVLRRRTQPQPAQKCALTHPRRRAIFVGRKTMALGAPRIVTINTVEGMATGIGIKMDTEGRAGKVVLVDYVEDSSPFAGQLLKGDEILAINDEAVHGDAKAASDTIKRSSGELRLSIQTPSAMMSVMSLGKKK